MFHNNIVKISEKINKWNLLKIYLQVTYPTYFCLICIQFYYEKKYDKWLCIKSWQKYANFLLLWKSPSKKPKKKKPKKKPTFWKMVKAQ